MLSAPNICIWPNRPGIIALLLPDKGGFDEIGFPAGRTGRRFIEIKETGRKTIELSGGIWYVITEMK